MRCLMGILFNREEPVSMSISESDVSLSSDESSNTFFDRLAGLVTGLTVGSGVCDIEGVTDDCLDPEAEEPTLSFTPPLSSTSTALGPFRRKRILTGAAVGVGAGEADLAMVVDIDFVLALVVAPFRSSALAAELAGLGFALISLCIFLAGAAFFGTTLGISMPANGFFHLLLPAGCKYHTVPLGRSPPSVAAGCSADSKADSLTDPVNWYLAKSMFRTGFDVEQRF